METSDSKAQETESTQQTYKVISKILSSPTSPTLFMNSVHQKIRISRFYSHKLSEEARSDFILLSPISGSDTLKHWIFIIPMCSVWALSSYTPLVYPTRQHNFVLRKFRARRAFFLPEGFFFYRRAFFLPLFPVGLPGRMNL